MDAVLMKIWEEYKLDAEIIIVNDLKTTHVFPLQPSDNKN